jgi:hypothetical protein
MHGSDSNLDPANKYRNKIPLPIYDVSVRFGQSDFLPVACISLDMACSF